jgi:hypothetical protein
MAETYITSAFFTGTHSIADRVFSAGILLKKRCIDNESHHLMMGMCSGFDIC